MNVRVCCWIVLSIVMIVSVPVSAQGPHDADLNGDWVISHEELLRVIELWRAGEYHLDASGQFVPGPPEPGEPGEMITIEIPGLPERATPLDMILIPAGTFTMGSPSGEKDRYSDEGPQHEVTISQPFYLGKYEVTQAQWEAVMGNNPSYFAGKPNNPVEQVSWNDCQAFIEKLNGMGLGTFRLPTEAEWEYACRAGTTTRFYWGDDPNSTEISDYAWWGGNENVPYYGTKEVALKLPNDWGLFDMSGNVLERCEDDWRGSYAGAPVDGSAWVESPRGSHRVYRGGSWYYGATYFRSADRGSASPGSRSYGIGFRLVRSYP